MSTKKCRRPGCNAVKQGIYWGIRNYNSGDALGWKPNCIPKRGRGTGGKSKEAAGVYASSERIIRWWKRVT